MKTEGETLTDKELEELRKLYQQMLKDGYKVGWDGAMMTPGYFLPTDPVMDNIGSRVREPFAGDYGAMQQRNSGIPTQERGTTYQHGAQEGVPGNYGGTVNVYIINPPQSGGESAGKEGEGTEGESAKAVYNGGGAQMSRQAYGINNYAGLAQAIAIANAMGYGNGKAYNGSSGAKKGKSSASAGKSKS